jgi:hypothetical protein
MTKNRTPKLVSSKASLALIFTLACACSDENRPTAQNSHPAAQTQGLDLDDQASAPD